jgi:hypothetical protein
MVLGLSTGTTLPYATVSKAVMTLRIQEFILHGKFVYSHSFVFILRLQVESGSWDVYT